MSFVSSAAIVSTSIHREPAAYAEWVKQGELYVAGDRNSPDHLGGFVHEIGGEYISPDEQDHWKFSDSIGWNCVQRRNVAVMQAYADGYDYIATVDDDNFPTCDDWLEQHIAHLRQHFPANTKLLYSSDNWVDIGYLNKPECRQRGTLFGARKHYLTDIAAPRVVVSTAQVIGDPDTDAITRLTRDDVQVERALNAVVSATANAAFNSQATVWQREWAPLIACIPHIGRYDDIVASFIAKHIMRQRGVSFFAGNPCVRQERNKHDFTNDLRAEVWGIDHTTAIVDALGLISARLSTTLSTEYQRCAGILTDILPRASTRFMREWVREWEAVSP